MSAMGQKQTSDWRPLMSALPPKADIAGRQLDVRFVPKADIHSTPAGAGRGSNLCRHVADGNGNMQPSPANRSSTVVGSAVIAQLKYDVCNDRREQYRLEHRALKVFLLAAQ
jgi:hypothetical protein